MDKNIMLHYLRNPFNHDEHSLREARLQAADELERLYHMEKQLKDFVSTMCDFKKVLEANK